MSKKRGKMHLFVCAFFSSFKGLCVPGARFRVSMMVKLLPFHPISPP